MLEFCYADTVHTKRRKRLKYAEKNLLNFCTQNMNSYFINLNLTQSCSKCSINNCF